MRMAILGNSGSGKSTLARWFEQRGGAAVLDLDTVAWSDGAGAVRRPQAEAAADVLAFCASHPRWVVEGCYASLIEATLRFRPTLLFLNPGEAACAAHCRARPWEPHKYASREAQDENLAALLDWVRDYAKRDGELSLAGHRALFDSYAGPRFEFQQPVVLDPPQAELLAALGWDKSRPAAGSEGT